MVSRDRRRRRIGLAGDGQLKVLAQLITFCFSRETEIVDFVLKVDQELSQIVVEFGSFRQLLEEGESKFNQLEELTLASTSK